MKLQVWRKLYSSPGFFDYERSLNGMLISMIQNYRKIGVIISLVFSLQPICDVIWITNPHNPLVNCGTKIIEIILKKYKLVICDEAFLSITPNGEKESLIPLTKIYDNLLVIRSLTNSLILQV